MARRVFFSFHFEDSWRANQVRQVNVVYGTDIAGFYDHSEYEEEKRGPAAVRREILQHLKGTSVTIVLIGTHTAERPWVNFEIRESLARGNKLIGIWIHHLTAPPPGWPNAPRWAWGPSPQGGIPPALPASTPIYMWDAKKVRGFARVIEQAGRDAERLRLAAQRRALAGRRRTPSVPPSRPQPGPPPPLLSSVPPGPPNLRTQLQGFTLGDLMAPKPRPAPSLEDLLRDLRIAALLGDRHR